MRIERRLVTPGWLTIVVPVASVLVAVVLSGLVLVATQHDPVDTFSRILQRGFTGSGALSQSLVSSTPLLFTGLAAAVAFRMQVWNIGGEGQLYIGAMCSSGVALLLHDQSGFVIIVAMIAAGLAGGMVWGIIPGFLRARFSTNEIITSLMLNYVAGLLITYLIFDSTSYWRDTISFSGKTFPQGKPLPEAASWPSSLASGNPAVVVLVAVVAALAWWLWHRRTGSASGAAPAPAVAAPAAPFPEVSAPPGGSAQGGSGPGEPAPAGLATVAPRRDASGRTAFAWFGVALALAVAWLVMRPNFTVRVPMGFLVGLVVAAVLWVLFRATRFGFEVRVIGDSPAAAAYAGMRTRRKVLSIMALSGAVAGLGGASQVGDFGHVLDPRGLQQSGFGYTGIVVAALGRYNPFAVVLVSVLLGGVSNAGYSLQGPDFPAGLVGVIEGMILFCALGGELLLHYRFRVGGHATDDLTPPGERAAQLAEAVS